MRAARADPGPVLLVATDSLPTGHRLRLRHHLGMQGGSKGEDEAAKVRERAGR